MRPSASRRGNLPVKTTSFVGRRKEAGEIAKALGVSRLVTLTGVSGVGKSRLALHVGERMRRTNSGEVWLVELGSLTDPQMIWPRIASDLELSDLGGMDPRESVLRRLHELPALLILDNCEHLIDECASVVADVLAHSEQSRVLATSLEALSIEGEQSWPVPPLSLPGQTGAGADSAAQSFDAIALFEDRARSVVPGYALDAEDIDAVVRLCRQLDGLPLAIELAATRLRTLSVEQITARLADRFQLLTGDRGRIPRHRSLQTAIEWTRDMCTPEERHLWDRLWIFAGEFDLDAVTQVVGDPGDEARILDSISGLVEKSVLSSERRGRRVYYRMLESLRQYARGSLNDSEVARLRQRHCDHYLKLAEESERAWSGSEQAAWAARIDAEQANLWTALEYCLDEPRQVRSGLRLAGALCWYWVRHGAAASGVQWLDRLLTSDSGDDSRERATVLWVAAYLDIRSGEPDLALDKLDACDAMAGRLDDREALAHARQFRGHAMLIKGSPAEAIPVLRDAVELEEGLGSRSAHLAGAHFRLGLALYADGHYDDAFDACSRAEQVCRAQDDTWTLSWVLWLSGVIHWKRADTQEMLAAVRDALSIDHVIQDPLNIALSTELLAWSLVKNDPGRAAELMGASQSMWGPFGRHLFGFAPYIAEHATSVDASMRALGSGAFRERWRHGRSIGLDQIRVHALGAAPERRNGGTGAGSLLTTREREIAELVTQGLSNKEIAAQLVISPRTAESHIEHIFVKLGINSRARLGALMQSGMALS